jgi:putative chitinase
VPSKEEKPLEVSGVQATIVKSLNESGVTSPKAHANVLATVKAESNFKVQSENLNYSSPQRIQDVFGKRRIPSVEFAQPLVNNPEGLANEVYKTTDGNSAPGDGFKYRGRGFIQHTGKNQYAAISKFVGVDVLSNPDSLNSPEVAAKAIPWFLLSYKGLKPEDVENMSKVNKAIAFADPTGKKAAAREASSQQIYASMSSGPTGSQVATASNEVSSGQRQQAKSQTPMIVNAPTTNNTRVVNNQPATMTKDKANPTNMVLARVA